MKSWKEGEAGRSKGCWARHLDKGVGWGLCLGGANRDCRVGICPVPSQGGTSALASSHKNNQIFKVELRYLLQLQLITRLPILYSLDNMSTLDHMEDSMVLYLTQFSNLPKPHPPHTPPPKCPRTSQPELASYTELHVEEAYFMNGHE